ncbi:BnaA02g16190D [Brassica napus]|uniref:BnaA02g16190D protein n=1 Tax=Brassica napus TaxID=3708 RepID=A0A078IDP3_BRANA|nr:BnaA02g16190D [Brassica napus]
MNRILRKLSCVKTKVKTSLRLFESRSSLSSSSSASFTPKRFDVFLSFRGADTRRKFVSFLYNDLEAKEIRTFKDDKELESGRPIPPELIQAIKGSKIAVVVVSATYPASYWCLEELVKILKYERKGLLKVLPVFYEVDPSHLRWQIGEVAKQFKKHEKRQSKERVKSWRDALAYLANLSGECSKKWDDDSKLVDGITEKISKMFFSTTPTNGNNLIGIDQHMDELYPLLDLNSNQGVRVIGIWGRGSNGRSVLARHVYENISHNFDAHCLLEDVRRVSRHCRRSHLQEELLSKMQGEGLGAKTRCLNAIKARLRNKKILLVANDVDKIKQLDALAEEFSWFGPGSRIIITTQDRQLLSSSGVTSVYEVEILRCYEVRQLFRSEAFRQRDDPKVRQLFRSLAFTQRHEHVGLEEPTYRPMDLPDKSEGCCSVHLIDGDGIYNVSGIDHLIKEVSDHKRYGLQDVPI